MATPALIKNISRNIYLRSLACFLGSLYIRFIHATGSWRIENSEIPEKLIGESKTFITCFWHGRLMMMSYAWPYDTTFSMLISSHADGQLIAKTISRLGFNTVAGSTKRRGSEALRAMVRILKNGGCIGITPDGPRGPRMRASSGAIAAAKLAGVPILPLSYSARSWNMFSSWDRFILPRPFSKGIFIWGEPILVPDGADESTLELIRQDLETALNTLTEQADQRCGQVTPEAEHIGQ